MCPPFLAPLSHVVIPTFLFISNSIVLRQRLKTRQEIKRNADTGALRALYVYDHENLGTLDLRPIEYLHRRVRDSLHLGVLRVLAYREFLP